MKPSKMNTNIYFLQAEEGGPIKIGKAKNYKLRKSAHQTSNYKPIRNILIIKNVPEYIEKELHFLFYKYKIRGEWYEDKIMKSNSKNFENFVKTELSKYCIDWVNCWYWASEKIKNQVYYII